MNPATRATILLLLAAAALAFPGFAQPRRDPPRVVVDGRVLQTDVAPQVVQGTTLLPIRFVAEALGARASWDSLRREAVILYEGQRIVIPLGEPRIEVGGRVIPIGTPAQVVAGRVLIPLRAVAEALNATVTWEARANTVTVQTAANRPGGELPSPAELVRAALAVEIRTARDAYPAGVPIQINLRVYNKSDRPVRLAFASGQHFDVLAEREGRDVWRWSNRRFFTQATNALTFLPGETRTFSITWSQRDNEGGPVPPGTYTLTGMVTHVGEVPLRDTKAVTVTAGPSE